MCSRFGRFGAALTTARHYYSAGNRCRRSQYSRQSRSGPCHRCRGCASRGGARRREGSYRQLQRCGPVSRFTVYRPGRAGHARGSCSAPRWQHVPPPQLQCCIFFYSFDYIAFNFLPACSCRFNGAGFVSLRRPRDWGTLNAKRSRAQG